jgi:hypothetical protein
MIACRRLAAVLVVLFVAGCSSSTETTEPPSPTTTLPPRPSPSASEAPALDACLLMTAGDTISVLGWSTSDRIEDTFSHPAFAGSEDEFSSGCVYEPVDDSADFAALGVFTPEHMASAFDQEVARGTQLLGLPYQAYNVEGTVFFRSEDVGFIVVASTSPGQRDAEGAVALVDRASLKLDNLLHPPSPDPSLPACQRLTPDVVEAAAGPELALVFTRAFDPKRSQCVYSDPAKHLQVIFFLTEGAADARADFNGLKQGAISAGRYHEITGIGDEAYENTDLFVLAGDEFFDIAVLVDSDHRDLDLEKDIARGLLAG